MLSFINYFLMQLKTRINNEKGQGMVEYGLIIGLIAIVVIAALTAMGDGLESVFNNITGELNNATP
jgi:pilus assembly protein Flp/PilA